MPISRENLDLYPPDWPEISRRIRFERAGGRCEWKDGDARCEARHLQPHPITGSKVILTTMHLNHRPQDCAEENLLAACQLHHNRYDRAHRDANRKRRGDILASSATRSPE